MSIDTLERSKSGASTPTEATAEGLLYIGGRWLPPSSDKPIDTINPATEEVAGRIAAGTSADLDAAVEAARSALDGPWSKLTGIERGDALARLRA